MPHLSATDANPADSFLYQSGAFYDLMHGDATADLPFWLAQAARFGGPILELAAGTGRITLPLALAGHEITGVDLSSAMLGEARRKSAEMAGRVTGGIPVTWVQADIRDFDLRRDFNLIIFPFNTLCHLLTIGSLEACLACVRRHLRLGGRFIVDMFVPNLSILLHDSAGRYEYGEYDDPDSDGVVSISTGNQYDSATQINHVILYETRPGRDETAVGTLEMRMYFPQELDALLSYNGLRVIEKYGDYDELPFGPDAPKQLIICELTKSL
jgi:SAM-dependent methyltransferase